MIKDKLIRQNYSPPEETNRIEYSVYLGEGESASIFRKQSKFKRIPDTFVEITVNILNVKANFRKRGKIESP
ncbi:hypothetical protein LGL55_18920 [Clostridium tagluense]|uniref:hypothetical protein n=1 Tax=Clostridium tagluense TaxID=360422 RepID=UPI001CF36D10|nr:hypothetical protein [Clostridium tagluense]MCB2322833.1 hypothetical protein [Clostridium tagluense]MCB2336732.1 hypothetical protein [Clostridium tagluense]MCB2366272.1 hypothetical protein [Clostridium tagluense]